MLHEHLRLEGAVFQARAALRAYNHNDFAGGMAIQNRMCDTLEASRHPNLLLEDLVRRLGRHNALDVGVDPKIVRRVLAF